ncbi:MAG: hypothetical protein R2867_15795 [Caldilineaceae bacterium]
MPERDGIHIGEAALFLVTRAWPCATGSVSANPPMRTTFRARTGWFRRTRGDGTGIGTCESNAADIDYINLHGTATEQNDAMESIAVSALFGTAASISPTPVSSTKHSTGHPRRGRSGGSRHLLDRAARKPRRRIAAELAVPRA